MTSPVFVSHSSRDLVRVRALVNALEARGVACWLSERNIAAGDNYGDSIVDAIENARAMVLVFSPSANNSDEIKKEVALASQRRITVVPVRIEDTTPSKAFRYELATRNWIDFFPDWEDGVAKLHSRLAAILDLPLKEKISDPPLVPVHSRGNGAVYMLGGLGAAILATIAWMAVQPPAMTSAAAHFPSQAASKTPAPQEIPIATSAVASAAVPTADPAAPGISSSPTTESATPQKASKPLPTTPMPPRPTGIGRADPPPAETPQAANFAANPASEPPVAADTVSSPTRLAAVMIPAPLPTAAAPTAESPGITLGPPPAIMANSPGGEIFKECDRCPEMVVVPAGKAMLGSPLGESGRQTFEMPPHEVDIARPFAVGRYAVTYDEWDACFAEGGCGHRRLGDLDFGRGRRPAIFASWEDAQRYVEWLKAKTGQPYRLLSEAEWEYAARACSTLKCPYAPFWFGAIKPELAVYDWRHSYQGSPKASALLKTAAADSGPPNPFGLYNMLGNVRQWTLDCWSATPASAAADGAAATTGDCRGRATRGGSWADEPVKLRAGARDWQTADEGSEKIGFRVARTLSP